MTVEKLPFPGSGALSQRTMKILAPLLFPDTKNIFGADTKCAFPYFVDGLTPRGA